ncbi:MAG: Conserved hypothetical lipoprotein [Bacteroidetes bacterium]|jgi:uncharacterized protein (DUF2141 family)|nr:Conserved hypothetical lipoprotein [Bacteroidota bacterium]
MKRYFAYTALIISVFFLFERCAQVIPLTGGPRDSTPPKLEESVPAESSVNFNNDKIVLLFNEYVQLKDLKNQLVVSPKLKTDPEISTDGKKVEILIKKEELTPNTTYRIYFGRAIADMTEGNAIPNFEYVFSTGAYIDSLKVKGTITDAFNEQPFSDLVVGLYTIPEKQNDSLIYKETPDYLTRTLIDGNFNFVHLPKKKFKMVAFQDKNKNYLYDGETEKIAFKETELDLSVDSNIRMRMFQEDPAKLFVKKTMTPYYGIVNVIYNRKSVFKTSALNKEESNKVFESAKGLEKDTVSFYYADIKDSLGLLITDQVTQRIDTIKATLPKLNTNRKKTTLYTTNVEGGILPNTETFKFSFYNLTDTLKTNPDKMMLFYKKDTIEMKEAVKLKYSWPARAEIANKLIEGVNYKLKTDTAAIFDVNGKYNDSSVVNFKVQSKTDLGKVTLKVLLNLKQSYIVQLINDRGQAAKQEFISFSLSSSNAATIDFTGVSPGSYGVKIIFDNNENKKWDTGNYLLNKQPERVYISSKQIKALPDWEVEEEILVK